MTEEDILKAARTIKELRTSNLSEKVKDFLVHKAVANERAACPKCGGEVYFPALAQTSDVKASGHLAFWCHRFNRGCSGEGIETDLKWYSRAWDCTN